jgi:hypothetical protein
LLSLVYGDAADTYLDENFGSYDLNGRYVYDESRPGVYDSGALRFVPLASFNSDAEYDSGQYEYNTWDVEDDVQIVVSNTGNITIAIAFDLQSNSMLSLQNGARFSVKEGNGTCAGTFQVSNNSTLSYGGRLTLAFNSTLSVLNVRNVTISHLLMQEGSELVFGEVGVPIRISRSLVLGGRLVIVLLFAPVIARGARSTSTTVQVATFPANTTTGTFSSAVAVASYAN